MLEIHLRVTLRASLTWIKTHLGAFLEVTGCALQTFMHRAFQITTVIRSRLMTFLAQAGASINRNVRVLAGIVKRQLVRCVARRVMADFAFDRLPFFHIGIDHVPRAFLIERLYKIAYMELAGLEWGMASDTFVCQ